MVTRGVGGSGASTAEPDFVRLNFIRYGLIWLVSNNDSMSLRIVAAPAIGHSNVAFGTAFCAILKTGSLVASKFAAAGNRVGED